MLQINVSFYVFIKKNESYSVFDHEARTEVRFFGDPSSISFCLAVFLLSALCAQPSGSPGFLDSLLLTRLQKNCKPLLFVIRHGSTVRRFDFTHRPELVEGSKVEGQTHHKSVISHAFIFHFT